MSQFFQNPSSAGGIVDSIVGSNGVTASPSTGNVTVSGVNATTTTVGVASFNPADFTVSPSGEVSTIASANPLDTLSDDVGTVIAPSAGGNIQLQGHVVNQTGKFSTVLADASPHIADINPMTTSRWIVDPLGFNGTHTSIPAAITASTSGDTIFLMDGTYVGSFTAKPGVDIVAFGSDEFDPNVTIEGTITFATAGIYAFSGISFSSNGAPIFTSSGSNTVGVSVSNSVINCNGTDTAITSTNANFTFHVFDSVLAGPGSLYNLTNANEISFFNCTGSVLGASSNAAGTVHFNYSTMGGQSNTTLTGSIIGIESFFSGSGTQVTTAGTGASTFYGCDFSSGANPCLSIGAGTTVTLVGGSINSSASHAISGAGTLNHANLTFVGSAGWSTVNVSTSNALSSDMVSVASLPLSLALGGTNAALTASNGGIFYSTATAGAILSGTATGGQLLTSGASTAPAWTTSTYPATNAINTLLYASSANTMAALATGNSGVLITSSGGVPSISSTLPSAVQGNITSLGTITSGVWNGTIVTPTYGGTGVSTLSGLALGNGTSNFTAVTYVANTSWTPVIQGATSAGTGTYSQQTGTYQREGNRVFFTANLTWTAHTGTGIIQIGGWPIPFSSNNTEHPITIVSTNDLLATTATSWTCYGVGGTSVADLYGYIVSTGTLVNTALGSNTSANLFISGVYEC